jgi:hypothetical protein
MRLRVRRWNFSTAKAFASDGPSPGRWRRNFCVSLDHPAALTPIRGGPSWLVERI